MNCYSASVLCVALMSEEVSVGGWMFLIVPEPWDQRGLKRRIQDPERDGYATAALVDGIRPVPAYDLAAIWDEGLDADEELDVEHHVVAVQAPTDGCGLHVLTVLNRGRAWTMDFALYGCWSDPWVEQIEQGWFSFLHTDRPVMASIISGYADIHFASDGAGLLIWDQRLRLRIMVGPTLHVTSFVHGVPLDRSAVAPLVVRPILPGGQMGSAWVVSEDLALDGPEAAGDGLLDQFGIDRSRGFR